jgi:hypothetical protein
MKLDKESIDIIMDKYVPSPDEDPDEDVVRILQMMKEDMPELKLAENPIDPRRLQRLVSAWRYNSFGHHTEDGLVLYNRISMCAHSCDPSCCWSYGNEDAFVLRARIALKSGDEITISYLQDEDLLKSTSVRVQSFTIGAFRVHVHGVLFPLIWAAAFVAGNADVGYYIRQIPRISSLATFAM